MRAPDGEARISGDRLFFRSSNMLGVLVSGMTMQRRTDPQKKLKGVAEIIAVITIEAIGAIVERELGAQPDVETVAVR